MADKYFNWAAATPLERAYELKSRNWRVTLRHDPGLTCCLRCNAIPKQGDVVYWPSRAQGASNKIIAHAKCVDRMTAQHTAQSAVEARNGKKDLILTALRGSTAPKLASNGHNGSSVERPQDVLGIAKWAKEQASQNTWQSGYEAGYDAALDDIWNALQAQMQA